MSHETLWGIPRKTQMNSQEHRDVYFIGLREKEDQIPHRISWKMSIKFHGILRSTLETVSITFFKEIERSLESC